MRGLHQKARYLRTTGDQAGRRAASVFQPSRAVSRYAHAIILRLNSLGFWRLDPEEGDEVFSPAQGAAAKGYASFSSSARGRRILSSATNTHALSVAKCSPGHDEGIYREAAFYTSFGASLSKIFAVPELIHHEEAERTLLITKAVNGTPTYDEHTACNIAVCLAKQDITHGDFAPWNILSTSKPGPHIVLDWESWTHACDTPYFDILNFLYRRASLTSKITPDEFYKQLASEQSCLRSFESALGLGPYDWNDGLQHYLSSTDPEPKGHPARHFRERLQELAR